jgi:hypothetical protein
LEDALPSQFKLFDKKVKACNPYKEFWEFLEWLARRRQYPDPIYVWRVTNSSQQRPAIKLSGAQKNGINQFERRRI